MDAIPDDVPLVSVVIPAYRGGPRLREAARSMAAQDLVRIEILVVSDGSADPMTDLEEIDPRIRVFREPHAGVSATRNVGLARARAEFVAFLDDDDLAAVDRLRIQYDGLQANPDASISSCAIQAVGEDGQPIESTVRLGPSCYHAMLRAEFINSMSAVMVRRSVALGVGGFDVTRTTGEDIDFELRVARGHDVVRVEQALAFYRRHAANTAITPWRAYRDLDPLLKAHRAQAKTSGDRPSETAAKAGIALNRRYNALSAFHQAREAWAERSPRRAIQCALSSVTIDPFAGIGDLVAHRLPARFRHRT